MSKQRTWLIVAVVFAVFIGGAALFTWHQRHEANLDGKSTSESTVETLEVGALLPLTGPGAVFADYIKKGLDLAATEINGKQAGSVSILYRDSQNDPTVGATVFRQMVLTDSPPVIITALSSVTKAVAPLAAPNNTVVIGTAVSLPGVTDASDFVFRVYPEAEGVAGVIGRYAAGHCATAAVAHINDDFGISGAAIFERELASAGGRVLLAEPYNLLEKDFRGQWEKVREANPDCVWIIGYGPAYSVLIRQYRELGLPSRLLGDMTLGLPITLNNVGDAAEGVVYVDAPIDQDFAARYQELYQDAPTSYSGYAYDIMMMLDKNRAQDISPSSIRAGLASTGEYFGVMGPIAVLPNGDTSLRFVLMQIVDGHPQELNTQAQ